MSLVRKRYTRVEFIRELLHDPLSPPAHTFEELHRRTRIPRGLLDLTLKKMLDNKEIYRFSTGHEELYSATYKTLEDLIMYAGLRNMPAEEKIQ